MEACLFFSQTTNTGVKTLVSPYRVKTKVMFGCVLGNVTARVLASVEEEICTCVFDSPGPTSFVMLIHKIQLP